MIDPHPALAGFALPAFTLLLAYELYTLVKGDEHKLLAKAFTLIGCIGTLLVGLAFLSGYLAGQNIEPTDLRAQFIAEHHQWGRLLLISSLIYLGVRIAFMFGLVKAALFRIICPALCSVPFMLAIITGWHGGQLVFKHGVGVYGVGVYGVGVYGHSQPEK